MKEPEIAKCGAFVVAVEEGKKYFWCACGRSKEQPFCDGSHSGTGITPVFYQAKETKDVSFCGCKQTKKEPVCDGSHKKLAPKN
ncbi:MAG: iron-binding zinc finger protein type [Rickettsiales bacterium]|jgi:CDGSH-type Zn-finger protein|nr:iron-binding zinc finger protein type [Rickettsiales bacterium]